MNAAERIAALRAEIDTVDEDLVRLLNRRAGWALKIGRSKRAMGLRIYEPERESEIIARVGRLNGGPLSRAALQRLFERIIDESRSLERVPEESTGSDAQPSGNSAS
ncbi:MAG: chorismate mutase [Acidobacteria bacterium]|nr:chorismate mutase [Acidobacteriota bacterium]MCZ6833676.1 chorismate mutase [Acidobacteriota bacterium]